MKRITCFLFLIFCLNVSTFSQDDDLYFVSSKNKKDNDKQVEESKIQIIESNEYSYDNYSDEDIDRYNRRNDVDSVAEDHVSYEEEIGTYTSRLVRFHSPTVGVYISSPYYIDYYDWFYPHYPWNYNIFYDLWYYGYYPSSYWYSWNYWGAWNPWYYGPAWGYRPYPGYMPLYPIKPSYSYHGPGNRYGGRGTTTSMRPSSRYFSNGPSKNDKPNTHQRPGTSRYSDSKRDNSSIRNNNASRPSRNFSTTNKDTTPKVENRRPSSNYTPSRNFGNSNRSYSTPSGSSRSRSFGTGSSRGGRR